MVCSAQCVKQLGDEGRACRLDRGGLEYTAEGADGHLRSKASGSAEERIDTIDRHSGRIGGPFVVQEVDEPLCYALGCGGHEEAKDIAGVLVHKPIRPLGAVADLVDLGQQQRRRPCNVDGDAPWIRSVESGNLDRGVIDQGTFQPSGPAGGPSACSPPSRAPLRPPGGATASGTMRSTGTTRSSCRCAIETRASQMPGSGWPVSSFLRRNPAPRMASSRPGRAARRLGSMVRSASVVYGW